MMAAQAPKYIGLICVAVLALAMVLSVYYLLMKRRMGPSGGGLHDPLPPGGVAIRTGHGSSAETVVGTLQRASSVSNGGRNTTAYTITINSQSAASLDEAILPLTEGDKSVASSVASTRLGSASLGGGAGGPNGGGLAMQSGMTPAGETFGRIKSSFVPF